MPVRLVSSNPMEKLVPVRLVIRSNPPLSDFVCLDWHLAVCREAEAMLINQETKTVVAAAFRCDDASKDERKLFIKNIYLGVENISCTRPEIAIVMRAATTKEMSTEGRILYVREFILEQHAELFAGIKLKKLLFREGHVSTNAVAILKSGGVEVIRVDI